MSPDPSPRTPPAHTPSGDYGVADLIPPEARDLTLEQLLVLVAAQIVQQPDEVEIVVVNHDRIKVIEFTIAPHDRAQFLGRGGQTINALRTVAKAILGPFTKQYSYRIDMAGD